MGMAASQVRLLSLTSRQHTIEYRAQFLQAQKLRLSNDSDTVYERYINALDATKLETRVYDSDGKAHWIDGSYNNLMRYNDKNMVNGNVYYVQDINDGKLYIPQYECDAYNNSGGDYLTFLNNLAIQYTEGVHTPEYIAALEKVNQDIANGWNNLPYDETFISRFNELKYKVDNPDKSPIYKSANEIYNLVTQTQNSDNGTYLPSGETQYDNFITNLNEIKLSSLYRSDSELKSAIDYCLSFNISEIFDNPENVNTLTAKTDTNDNTYVNYDKTNSSNKEIDNSYKLKMLLNGGTYNLNNGTDKDIYNTTGNAVISNYSMNQAKNIGDVLKIISIQIMDDELDQATRDAQLTLDTFLGDKDAKTIELQINNYNQYQEDLAELNKQDPSTHIEYALPEKALYYEAMFYSIKSAGGCKPISDEQVNSSTWVNNMVKNAQVVLGVYDSEKKELDNTSTSSNTGLREISNDEEIAIADSEYEANLQAINAKETKFQTELNQLEEERNAIQTEIESLKKIAKENIESTFKTFT